MKKISLIFLIAIILVGCDLGKENNDNREYIENKYIISENYEYITDVEGYDYIEIPILNDTDFDLGKDKLDLFYTESKYIPYIDFENYINLMSDVLDEDLIITFDENSDTWSILFDDEGDIDYITFDFMNNTVELSTIQMIDSAFKNGESAEELVEIMEEYYEDTEDEIIEEGKTNIIELSNYDLELVSKDDVHLIPMHVLMFLFSPYDNKFYYNGDNAYFSDLFSSDIAYTILSELEEIEYTDEIVDFSNSFTRLVFENFYGLIDIKNEEVYSVMDDYTKGSYLSDFSEYIKGFDERHTSIVLYTYGYTIESLYEDVFSYEFSEVDSRIDCNYTKDLKTTILDDNTALVEVNTLSEPDFAKDYFEEIDEVRNMENIIIDLKCNGGGYVANAPVVIYPFIDERIDINSYALDGQKTTSPIIKTDNIGIETITDANVYLLTSDNTFSAANLATSMFNDYGVGEVIGERSGGGTAAIALVSHPNGSILSMSFGSLVLTDKDFNIIEEGIEPDIPFNINSLTLKSDLLEIVESN